MDRTYPYIKGFGLPNNHNSIRTLIHTILMEDVSFNILIEGILLISLIMALVYFMYIHSSHENINIVTLIHGMIMDILKSNS